MGMEQLEGRWEQDETACWAHRRAHAHRLLSMGFGPPTPYLLRLLSTGEYLGYLRQALDVDSRFQGPLEGLAVLFRGGDPAGHVESEYPRLFPLRVSPLGHDHGGPPAERVRAFYRMAGAGLAASPLPPDHISVETAFLAHLSEGEMRFARGGRTREAEGHREWTQRFLHEHLGLWVPRFAREVEAAGSPFYSPLARVLAGWVEVEGETR